MTILPIYQDMKWNCANFCVISREIAKIIWIRFKLGFIGWPKSKSGISNASASEMKHFWPHVGKVKIGLRGDSFLC